MSSALFKLLKEHRLRAGLSRAELSRRTGIDPSYLLRLEQGKATNPPIDTVIKLATVLGATLEDLLYIRVSGRPARKSTVARQSQIIMELQLSLQKALSLIAELGDA